MEEPLSISEKGKSFTIQTWAVIGEEMEVQKAVSKMLSGSYC